MIPPETKEPVSLTSLASYEPHLVREALERLLEPLGGMGRFVSPGQRVLLKPNLLAGKPPEKAVTTHPQIVRAVAEMVIGAGGRICLGDSPGIGSAENVARKCGIMAVVDELGLEFTPFEESTRIKPQGQTFQELEVAKVLLDADVVINLPILKTHQMMGMTCAVKNMFGAVVGLRKPRLHLQAGSDKALFALMLLELCEQLKPALTIVDAVVGMEGDGPGSGDPVQIGALIAGQNPLAVDSVATELVGLTAVQVWTQQISQQTGRNGAYLDQVRLLGDPISDLKIQNFRAAKSTDINGHMPKVLQQLLKNSLTAHPEPDHEICTACGICVEHCPPEAMRINSQRLEINYNRCIRCFCCQELCPQGALATRQGRLLKLLQLFRG